MNDDTRKFRPLPAPKPSKQRDEKVTVRMNDEEFAAFAAAADKHGLTLPTWFRLIGRQAVGLPVVGA